MAYATGTTRRVELRRTTLRVVTNQATKVVPYVSANGLTPCARTPQVADMLETLRDLFVSRERLERFGEMLACRFQRFMGDHP